MRLILVGCEYAGKTTLANEIVAWTGRTMGGGRSFHDHFTIPNPELTPESQEQFLKLSPEIKEMYQRFMMAYHLSPEFYKGPDHNMVGFHIDEAVYAPLYYGYGGEGEYADRKQMARRVEAHIMEVAPDTVLVLVKASPEVIASRMKEKPHDRFLVKEDDIERVLQRFEEENERSFIRRKFTLDTTSVSVEESLAEFVEKYEPHLTEADRLRILTHGGPLMAG
jgi:hypothetical protein